MSKRDSLRQRFASLRRESREEKRREDWKGERVKVNFRLPTELARKLQVLKLAEGRDKNDLVVAAVERAVDEALRAARERFDDAAWEVIERCARGFREEGD